MFTSRFIKVPIRVYDIDHKELTGGEILEDSYEKINPMDICAYRPTTSGDDEEEVEATCVEFKNGRITTVILSIEKFEKLLNSHQK